MKNPLARKITYGSLVGYALPTVAMMFFMAVYTIVDSLFGSGKHSISFLLCHLGYRGNAGSRWQRHRCTGNGQR